MRTIPCAPTESQDIAGRNSEARNAPRRAPPHLRLDVVQHLALRLHQHGHVQEDLVQVQQALLQLPHRLPPLLNLRQRVLHLWVGSRWHQTGRILFCEDYVTGSCRLFSSSCTASPRSSISASVSCTRGWVHDGIRQTEIVYRSLACLAPMDNIKNGIRPAEGGFVGYTPAGFSQAPS